MSTITNINYSIPLSMKSNEILTTLKIYTLNGKVIKEIYCGYVKPGRYRKSWNGDGENGEKLPSGVYLCTISGEIKTVTQKLFLVR